MTKNSLTLAENIANNKMTKESLNKNNYALAKHKNIFVKFRQKENYKYKTDYCYF